MASCGSKEQTHEVETLLVGTERAEKFAEMGSRPYVGTVEEMESTLASFTGTGTLQSVPVEEGQHVQRGQVIAVLDKVQAQNAVNAASAMLTQAKDAQQRMEQLYDANSLPEMKWIEVQSKVQQAQSSYDMAVKALQECTLTAPVSGVIGKKYMKSGEVALPSEPIVSILDISRVRVKVSVPESEIAHIGATTPSTIRIDALGESFAGGHIDKGVSADPLTHTYDIRIVVDNASQHLLPGMVAQVVLQGEGAQEPVITLPVRSVQQDSKGEKFVWTVKEGKAVRRTVTLGDTQGNRIAIVAGLEEGEQVITAGYQKVSEGSKVEAN